MSNEDKPAVDKLAQMIVDEKIKGRSFVQISGDHGIPVEEVILIYRQYLADATIRDPLEHRLLLQLRTEKIIDHLWAGLEAGSFKHGEAILKAVNTLQELHNLNEQAVITVRHEIEDADTDKVLEVLKHASVSLLNKVARLPLSAKAKDELKAWPEWAAEASTNAVEEVIYAEIEE